MLDYFQVANCQFTRTVVVSIECHGQLHQLPDWLRYNCRDVADGGVDAV